MSRYVADGVSEPITGVHGMGDLINRRRKFDDAAVTQSIERFMRKGLDRLNEPQRFAREHVRIGQGVLALTDGVDAWGDELEQEVPGEDTSAAVAQVAAAIQDGACEFIDQAGPVESDGRDDEMGVHEG